MQFSTVCCRVATRSRADRLGKEKETFFTFPVKHTYFVCVPLCVYTVGVQVLTEVRRCAGLPGARITCGCELYAVVLGTKGLCKSSKYS